MKRFIIALFALALVGCKQNRPEAAIGNFLNLAAKGEVNAAMDLLVVDDQSIKNDIIELIATRKTYELIKLIARVNSNSIPASDPGMMSVKFMFDLCTTKVEGRYKVCVYEDNTPQAVVEKFFKFVGRGDSTRAMELMEAPDEATRKEILAMIDAKDTVKLMRSIARFDIRSMAGKNAENFSTMAGLDFCAAQVDGKYKICVDETAWSNRPDQPATN